MNSLGLFFDTIAIKDADSRRNSVASQSRLKTLSQIENIIPLEVGDWAGMRTANMEGSDLQWPLIVWWLRLRLAVLSTLRSPEPAGNAGTAHPPQSLLTSCRVALVMDYSRL
jgi:hypothetical protein